MSKIQLFLIIIMYLYTTILFSQNFNRIENNLYAENNTTYLNYKDTTETKKKEKKFPFVAIPTLTYDRSQGAGFGLMSMGLFKADNSKKAPLSRIMVIGNYATNGSYYAMGGTRLYLNEDTWRILAAIGYISYNFQAYQYFEDGNMEFQSGVFETPYTTKGGMVVTSVQRKIFDNFYLGVGAFMMKSDVTFTLPDNTKIVDPNNTNSLAMVFNYDTRNSIYNPNSGIFIDGRISTVAPWLNNDQDYKKTMLLINHYKKLNNTKVLASRFAMKANFGEVPFAAQDYIGQTDLRGYTQGEYRGNQTYTAQSEFRNNFYKKWGYVAFAGLGIAYRKSEEGAASGDWYNAGTSWSKPLPSLGTGIRYQVIEKENQKINAGIDVAVGRGDWGVYFRITEAF